MVKKTLKSRWIYVFSLFLNYCICSKFFLNYVLPKLCFRNNWSSWRKCTKMYTVVEKIHLVFKYSFPCLFKKKTWFIINLNRIPWAESKLLMPLGESQPLPALEGVETHLCVSQTEGKLVSDGKLVGHAQIPKMTQRGNLTWKLGGQGWGII